MSTWESAAASHDAMLADPPGDDPTWPKCENCRTELDDDKPSVHYCSLDCAYEAGEKGERLLWRTRFNGISALIDQVYGLAVEGGAAVWEEQKRINACIDNAVHEGDEATVASFMKTRRDLSQCAYSALVGCIAGTFRRLYIALTRFQEASRK